MPDSIILTSIIQPEKYLDKIIPIGNKSNKNLYFLLFNWFHFIKHITMKNKLKVYNEG